MIAGKNELQTINKKYHVTVGVNLMVENVM